MMSKYLQEEAWYKALTHWLFSVLNSLFSSLEPFKSEYVHQADVSFYMVCRNFDRHKYKFHKWETKLNRAFEELARCDDEASLVAGINDEISETTKAEIDVILEKVGRMRAIGIESRKVTNPGTMLIKSDKSAGAKKMTQRGDSDDSTAPDDSLESSQMVQTSDSSNAPDLDRNKEVDV